MAGNGSSSWRRAVRSLLLCALLTFCSGCPQAEWQEMGRQILAGAAAPSRTGSPLTAREIGAGLKEALRVGTERVVVQLGRTDGFNADPDIHIPLPDRLATARTTLDRFGMGGIFGDLELRLNRAAEAATPRAKALFWQAIGEMTLDDVRTIFHGPEDAATRYFQRKMSPGLAAAMRPVVDQTLNEVGAVRVYNQTVAQVRALPYAPEIKNDLTGYVVEQGMAGIFHYLAREEAAIRRDPAKRTTELLQRVFGAR